MFTLLDLCVSSLSRGHANLLCIVPILTDDPRRESELIYIYIYNITIDNNSMISIKHTSNHIKHKTINNNTIIIHVYIHMYICIYIYIYVHISLSLYIYIYIHVHVYLSLSISLSLSIYIYIYVYPPLRDAGEEGAGEGLRPESRI